MAATTGGQASTGSAHAPFETARQDTVPSSQLSIRNKLLFAQAVHRLGAPVGKGVGNNWNAVVSLLRDCPALEEKEKNIFTERNCRGFYDDLMAEAGFGDLSTLEGLENPNAKPHLKMAQYFYVQRMTEMKATIEDQEQQFQNLLAEIDAIKSGEAVYNPALLTQLRLAIMRIRGMSDKDAASVIAVDTLKDWTPTKEQLRESGKTPGSGQPKSASPAVEQEPLQQKDVVKVSSTLSASPPASASAMASPSPTPTPTPTPSVVVNGEILKPYPSADVQTTEPTDEVPPLQIQPKRPKDNFASGMSIGYDLGSSNGYDGSHAERSGPVKQEPYHPEQPTRIHTASAPAIRQDLGRAQRSATASPSPSISEMSAGTGAHRSRTIVDVKFAPTSANSFTASPVSSSHVKRDSMSSSKPDRPATAGVYNHRKIPVKNAASHSVTSGHSIMGDKRSAMIDSPPAKDMIEADVIVPDSQERK
ncbi:hypothetical protein NliqN6_2674 [Naganishia liquefaciens]|uniref:Uncharacterized protein n=1 Tax=Naganishia liquefaciens TaxID=104408 RepID=A0A8H3TSB6_9TREE|nr:hypothetical protein NliqN6_2674 [Naganishia liquefaciens]